MRSVYRFLLVLWGLGALGTVGTFAQTRNVQNDYAVGSSPYSYVAVSASNSSEFIDLLDYTPDAGNIDDGYYYLQLPFLFSFNGDGEFDVVRMNTNGSLQFLRDPGYIIDLSDEFSNWYGYPGQQATNYVNNAPANMVFGWGCDYDLTVGTPGLYYAVQGTSPNRRAIFEWRTARVWNTTTDFTFQIILNEGSNAIDVVFGSMNGSFPDIDSYDFYTGLNEGTAAVGSEVAQKTFNGQSGNFIGSKYSGTWTHSSGTEAAQPNIYTSTAYPSNQGLRYCYLPVIGSATNMTLFDAANNSSDRISIGNTVTKQYTVTNPNTAQAPIKVTTQITGAGGTAFSVTPSMVASIAPGASQTFNVKFAPTMFGDFQAVMNVNVSTVDGATCPVTKAPAVVALHGRVLGLTAQVDPLAINFGQVGINATDSRNVAIFKNEATVPMKYYFTGPVSASGDFRMVGATGSPATLSGTVPAGGFVYLPVEFAPTTNGVQTATINFYYTNESATARSVDQTITLSGEGTPSRLRLSKGTTTTHLASGSLFAQSFFGAVGEEPLSFDFTISNTGLGAPVSIRDFQFYDLDRENPINGRLRVMWTGGFGQGQPIASNDFRVQQYINGQWTTVGPNDVVSVPPQQSQQMRVQFTPDRRGVNFVRMFFRTNATVDDNYGAISALNARDVLTTGLQSYDFYGITARNSQIATINPLLFLETEVGETTTASLQITNKGDSRLLIEQNSLKLIDGDTDFSIESAFAGMEVDNGKYVIPVNQTGEIVIRFTPKAKGTRLTTLYLMSNDSSTVGGVIGSRFVPITGLGLARAIISVTAQTETTPFAGDTSIVSVPTSYVEADVRIRNMGNSDLNVTEVLLRGADMSDYVLVTPFSPRKLQPSQEMTVTVRFAPQSGGRKSGELVVKSNAQNGDQVVDLSGFGGERLVGASTRKIFGEDSIAVGQTRTGTVVIRNTGTVDLDLSAATITGGNADVYTITSSNNDVVIAPNEFVTLTVELQSSERGQKKALLTMLNNSTNEPEVTVELGGFVGVRTASYTPQQISMSSVLGQNGEYEEQTVCVEVTNTGDLPMTLTSIVLSGAQSSQYIHDGINGTVVGVGETTEVCVTYRPTSSMSAVAMLTIQTDGTPGTIDISINGIATSVGESAALAAGYRLSESVPSPAVTEAMIGYELGVGGMVRVELYDATGRLVRTLEQGYRELGRHELRVNVGDLESGVYLYRLSINGYELSQMLRIVK